VKTRFQNIAFKWVNLYRLRRGDACRVGRGGGEVRGGGEGGCCGGRDGHRIEAQENRRARAGARRRQPKQQVIRGEGFVGRQEDSIIHNASSVAITFLSP
jgi:hypothetical protein